MNPYPNNFYNEGDDDEDEISEPFEDDGFSDGDYDDEESESYYSEGEGESSFQESFFSSQGGSFQEEGLPVGLQQEEAPAFPGSTTTGRSGTTTSSSFDGLDDSFANATAPSDFDSLQMEQSMSSQDKLEPPRQQFSMQDRAAAYRREFEELIELAENGKQLTSEEDDRLYCLELFARQKVGEALTEDETLDLEDWLQEENEKEIARELEEETRDNTLRAGNNRNKEEESSESLSGVDDEQFGAPPARLMAPKLWESSTRHGSDAMAGSQKLWESSTRHNDSAPMMGEFSSNPILEESPKTSNANDFEFLEQPEMVESENSSYSKHSDNGSMGFEEEEGDRQQGPPTNNGPTNDTASPQSPNRGDISSDHRSPLKQKKKSSKDKELMQDFGEPENPGQIDEEPLDPWEDGLGPESSPWDDPKQSDWGDGFGDDPFGRGDDPFSDFDGFGGGGEDDGKDDAFGKMDPFFPEPLSKSAEPTLERDDAFGDAFGGGFGNAENYGFGFDSSEHDDAFGKSHDPRSARDDAFSTDRDDAPVKIHDSLSPDPKSIKGDHAIGDGFGDAEDGVFGGNTSEHDDAFGKSHGPLSPEPESKAADSALGSDNALEGGFDGTKDDVFGGKTDDQDDAFGKVQDPFSSAAESTPADSSLGGDNAFGAGFGDAEDVAFEGVADAMDGAFGKRYDPRSAQAKLLSADSALDREDAFGGRFGDAEDGTFGGDNDDHDDAFGKSHGPVSYEPDSMPAESALERENELRSGFTGAKHDELWGGTTDQDDALGKMKGPLPPEPEEMSADSALKRDGAFGGSFGNAEDDAFGGDTSGDDGAFEKSHDPISPEQELMPADSALEVDDVFFQGFGGVEDAVFGGETVDHDASFGKSHDPLSPEQEPTPADFDGLGAEMDDISGGGFDTAESEFRGGFGSTGVGDDGFEDFGAFPSINDDCDSGKHPGTNHQDLEWNQKSEAIEQNDDRSKEDDSHTFDRGVFSQGQVIEASGQQFSNVPNIDGDTDNRGHSGRYEQAVEKARSEISASQDQSPQIENASGTSSQIPVAIGGDLIGDSLRRPFAAFENDIAVGGRLVQREADSVLHTEERATVEQSSGSFGYEAGSMSSGQETEEIPQEKQLGPSELDDAIRGTSAHFEGDQGPSFDDTAKDANDVGKSGSLYRKDDGGSQSSRSQTEDLSKPAHAAIGSSQNSAEFQDDNVASDTQENIDDVGDAEGNPIQSIGRGSVLQNSDTGSILNMSQVDDWSDIEPPPSGLPSPLSIGLQGVEGEASGSFDDVVNHFDVPDEEYVGGKTLSNDTKTSMDSIMQERTRGNFDEDITGDSASPMGQMRGGEDKEAGIPSESEVTNNSQTQNLTNQILPHDDLKYLSHENDVSGNETKFDADGDSGDAQVAHSHSKHKKRVPPGWAGLLVQSSRGQASDLVDSEDSGYIHKGDGISKTGGAESSIREHGGVASNHRGQASQLFASEMSGEEFETEVEETESLNAEDNIQQSEDTVETIHCGESVATPSRPISPPMASGQDFEAYENEEDDAGASSSHLGSNSDNGGNKMNTLESKEQDGTAGTVSNGSISSRSQAEYSYGDEQPFDLIPKQAASSDRSSFASARNEENQMTSEQRDGSAIDRGMHDEMSTGSPNFDDNASVDSSTSIGASGVVEKMAPEGEESGASFHSAENNSKSSAVLANEKQEENYSFNSSVADNDDRGDGLDRRARSDIDGDGAEEIAKSEGDYSDDANDHSSGHSNGASEDMSQTESLGDESQASEVVVDSSQANRFIKQAADGDKKSIFQSGSKSSYDADVDKSMETSSCFSESHRLADDTSPFADSADDWSVPVADDDFTPQDERSLLPAESQEIENVNSKSSAIPKSEGRNAVNESAVNGELEVDNQLTDGFDEVEPEVKGGQQAIGNHETRSRADQKTDVDSQSSSKEPSMDGSWDPHATFQIENKDPELPNIQTTLKTQGVSTTSAHSDGDDSDTWSEVDGLENDINESIQSPTTTKGRTNRSVSHSTYLSTESTLHSQITFPDDAQESEQGPSEQLSVDQESVEQESVDQGSVDQGSVEQGSVDQGSVDQGAMDQESVDQGFVDQGSVEQGSVDQGAMDQESVDQGSLYQGSVEQESVERDSVDQRSINQASVDQASIASALSARKEDGTDGTESVFSNAQQSISHLQLSKKLEAGRRDQKTGMHDERSLATSGDKSTKSDATSKKYQMSEASIYLGEVFGKSESFFSDNKIEEGPKTEEVPETKEVPKVEEAPKAEGGLSTIESQHSRRSQHSLRSVSKRDVATIESQHSRRSQHSLRSVSKRDPATIESQHSRRSQHSLRSVSRRSQSEQSQSQKKTIAQNQDATRTPSARKKKVYGGKRSPSWRKANSIRSNDRRGPSLKSPRGKDRNDKSRPRRIRTPKEIEERKKKRRRRKRVKKEAKSPALLAFVASVNSAMLELEKFEEEFKDENLEETSAHELLHGFDTLMGVFLQLSDEIELMSTFAGPKKKKDNDTITSYHALKEVLSFAESLDQLFADLKPIVLDCFEEEPDEEMEDMLFRLTALVELLCETSHRVGQKQEWNDRAETTYVTLLELMELETLELQCYFEDVDVPEQGISDNIHEAWSATGHMEELQALELAANDPLLFRQICYEVMVSTDQWCPDVDTLMEICDIDPDILEEEPDPEYLEEEDLAPIPRAAEHILDKINGDPLPRPEALAAILRRILPPRAMTDLTLLDNFTSIRNTLDNPLGLSATNLVAITSAPEVLNDPGAFGVAGVGKTTLAAMVAEHPDVRRYFIDGVVWIYVGDKELTYSRYTQCLRDLVAQLDFYDGVPLFAELIHTPGECLTKRRRREEGFMIYARDTIVELLEDRSVLIILDDVCFEPDLDWFDFAPMPEGSQDDQGTDVALLVSTRARDLLPAADTVEVDMLDEDDAIRLLIQESGQLSHTLMAESKEARSVVRECANHPLAVKSVGRWLGLKHVTAGSVSSPEEIHAEIVKSMEKILKGGNHSGTDMMYEILSLSLSPAINGEATNIIKYCFAAFVIVFCDKEHISEFAMTEPTPIVPMGMAQLLFETLLEINESALLQEGSLFYAQKKEAAVLIPEALSALGVLKVGTYSDAEEEEDLDGDQKFLQVVHSIHHEYGEYLCFEEPALKMLTRDAEQEWNRALAEASVKDVEKWDENLDDAGHGYVLEMIVSHMIRGAMYNEASDLLANKDFVRGRLMSLGRESATRRHIKDCVLLSAKLNEARSKISKLERRSVMKRAYQSLGSQLAMEYDVELVEDPRIKDIEIARSHYEIGFSLAENRCWDAAIAHWESSQRLLENALGTVEVVAGIMYNIGVCWAEMNEYDQALHAIKQCLRIRGAIHGEHHILYAQTIQKIGDIFLGMSDYSEALESYGWALEVMNREPTLHRVEIGDILDNKGSIHRAKGELEESLKCHQEALRSKQLDLGEDHPELVVTYQHIGKCLSEQGNDDDAIVHLEEAIRLKELDLDGGAEGESDILTLEGFIHYIERNHEQCLECYEKALQILVTKAPYRKEKIASLLHLIGCVYRTSGEHKKAIKMFQESLRARRKVLGFVHLEVARTLFNMAFLYQSRHRLDKALRCLEEALKIRALRVPETETVAMTHEKIGSLCRAIGKMKKAQIEFETALRLRNMIHGKDHIKVASVLQELGDLMDDIGEYDQALSNYVDALDIRRTKLGIDDVTVAETLYSMGYTLHNNDEPDRALVCFDESLSIRKYQLGDDSKEVGDTLNMMGFLKAKRGDLEEALTILWDALRIRKKQKDKIKVSETLNNIGNVHREKQDYNVAVQCYGECLRIRRAELGDGHWKVADSLIALGNVLGDTKKSEEAMQAYQEALKIRTKVFGERDERVATVLQYMGTMEFKSGKQDRARDLFTEFIKIRKENNAMNDSEYVNVLFTIGNLHKVQGNLAQARQCWTEAYQVFQELGLEETNPQIASMMNDLLRMEIRDDDKADQRNAALSFLGKIVKRPTKDPNEPQKDLGGKKRQNGNGIQL